MVVIVSHDERLREVADASSGSKLGPTHAPAKLERAGETVCFCSRGCRAQYEEEHSATRVEVNR
jgi:YHS domain-containing protein